MQNSFYFNHKIFTMQFSYFSDRIWNEDRENFALLLEMNKKNDVKSFTLSYFIWI